MTPRSLLHVFAAVFIGLAAGGGGRADVRVRESAVAVWLENGQLSARFERASGQLKELSLADDGRNLLGRGHVGYLALGWHPWGADPLKPLAGLIGTPVLRVVKRGPESAELSFRWRAEGAQSLSVDLRYVLRDGEPGLHVYHRSEKATGMPDMQIEYLAWKLRTNSEVFDYRYVHDELQGPLVSMEQTRAVHADKSRELINETFRLPDGDIWAKHQWVPNERLTPVLGVTGRNVGIWAIYPHFDSFGGVRPHSMVGGVHETEGGPILLLEFENNYYGRGPLAVRDGFAKLGGPLFLYVNRGSDRAALWADAKRRAAAERAKWPYRWLDDPWYPQDRGTVSGRLSFADSRPMSGARVVLGDAASDWQSHQSPYLYWGLADAAGDFAIGQVRPGEYCLFAWVPGALGEFRREAVRVTGRKETKLGTLSWVPEPRGRLLWQIGVPDRSPREFAGAETLQPPGATRPNWSNYLSYHARFPREVDFVIGKSSESRDWFYVHPAGLPADPRYTEVQPPVPPGTRQEPIAWRVRFEAADWARRGRARLTLGFCSRRDTTLEVLLNGEKIGALDFPIASSDSISIRAGLTGTYVERVVDFEAGRLRPGENVLTLRHRRADWLRHVSYDFLRLEIAPEH